MRNPRLLRCFCVVLAGAACLWAVLAPDISGMALAAPRVLVTGGNKGIGRALCKQLVRDHGFSVFLGSRDESRGEQAIKTIIQEAPECEDRLRLLPLDVSDDASVAAAAASVKSKYGSDPQPLFGIVNNAGLGFQHSMKDTLSVNTYGARRVCNAFLSMLCPENGRIVNTASASGPMFVARCSPTMRKQLTNPDVTWEELDDLMQKAMSSSSFEPYGFSKACLNAYTMHLARQHPNLKINAVTPGFIDTDITRGMGATKTPDEGTKPAIYCLIGDLEGNGRYYGSDAVRSPLDRYRGPGDPPYTGP